MTLRVDHMRIALPGGFESRARRIGRLVSARLAERPVEGHRRIERMGISPVQVRSEWSDHRVASAIADAVHDRLRATRGE